MSCIVPGCFAHTAGAGGSIPSAVAEELAGGKGGAGQKKAALLEAAELDRVAGKLLGKQLADRLGDPFFARMGGEEENFAGIVEFCGQRDVAGARPDKFLEQILNRFVAFKGSSLPQDVAEPSDIAVGQPPEVGGPFGGKDLARLEEFDDDIRPYGNVIAGTNRQ